MDRFSLRGLPLTLRVLFTSYLLTVGLGYLLALVYLFLLDIEPHRQMGVGLLQGTIVKYYGKRDATKLEASLKGRMGEGLSEGERSEVIQWIRDGAQQKDFLEIQPIFLNNCAPCHSPASGLSISPLISYEEISVYADLDLGQSIRTLARVSHIHLFGMSFIFILTGMIFSLSEIRRNLRCLIVVLPFVAIWMDVLSWWFTKYEPLFAYAVLIGGALMGLSLAAQVLISLKEMWQRRGE